MRRFKFTVLSLLFYTIFSPLWTNSSAAPLAKYILVLNAGNSEFYWTKEQTKGIREALAQTKPVFQLTIEYLDIIRYDSDQYQEELRDLLLYKYLPIKDQIAGILVTDDIAFNFFDKNLSEDFKNIPLAASGVNQSTLRRNQSSKNRQFIALLEEPAYEDTIATALKLHPNTKRVVILSDQSAAAQEQITAVKSIEKKFSIKFEYPQYQSFNELANYLDSLTTEDLVFRFIFYTDMEGNRFTFLESMRFLRAHVKAPMYSFWHGVLGEGIIGGKLLSGYRHGQMITNMLIDILNHNVIDQPYIKKSESFYFFDYNLLKKFGISKRDLPKDSQLINQPFSFYQNYKLFTWSIVLTFAVLSLLLIFLSRTNRKLLAIRKALLSATRRAEAANIAKSQFLANISHEIRTPLNSVIGFSKFLQDKRLSAVERDSSIDTIYRNGKLLTALIDDILDLSKIEANHLELEEIPTSIIDVIIEIIRSLNPKAVEKNISLTSNVVKDADFPNLPKFVYTDPTRLRQILVNIIGNAVKFTDEGGVYVHLSVEGTTGDQLELNVMIKDSGRGMSAEEKQKIFQPFSQADSSTTRKYGGTGLGLVLSRKLAQALGGDVVLKESAPGVGSLFCISIKVRRAEDPVVATDTEQHPTALSHAEESTEPQESPTASLAKHAAPQPHDGHQIRVLLAEDTIDNQILVKTILANEGVSVDCASNGIEAVEKALSHHYDLVLMDIQMPSLDGYKATQRLRGKGYDRPIIALTAHATVDDRNKSIEAGCTDHLTKPFNFNNLIEVIKKYSSHSPNP